MEYLYELHVTMVGDEARNQALTELAPMWLGTWKFSKIDGDPVLGAGVKQYATAHPYCDDMLTVKKRCLDMRKYLEANKVKVLRDKAEMIVHDNKTP